MISVGVQHVAWPVRGRFTISRGSRTQADAVVVTLTDGKVRGRGECVPYAHYGESIESVTGQIDSVRDALAGDMRRTELQTALPAGAARNAVDCALWDVEAKRAGVRAWELPDIARPFEPLTTAYTLSLDSPENMLAAAARHCDDPLLKVKLGGGDEDMDRIRAVREGAPGSRLILDANEGWDAGSYETLIPVLLDLGVEMIEQPFPAGDDELLREIDRPIAICADEACHDSSTLSALVGKYDMINIKLDKTGGLSEALKLKRAALEADMQVMVGCMLGSSLSMAPAAVVAQGVSIVDLDGPLLLADDCGHGIRYRQGVLLPFSAELWG